MDIEGGGRGRGGGGRGRGRGGGLRGRRVVRLPQRRRFLVKSYQVYSSCLTLAMEIYLLRRKDPSTLRNLSKMVVPWTSILSVCAVFHKYKKRGREEQGHGQLLHHGPYFYFEEEGERVWHTPTCWEILSLVFALLHMSSSLFSWLRAVNGWEFGEAFSDHPLVFVVFLLWVAILDLCCP